MTFDALPARYNFPPAVSGDRWQPMPAIGPILIGGQAPTFPLVRARMQFRDATGELGMTLDSEDVPGRDGEILISSPETWLMHLPLIPSLPLAVGTWNYSLRLFAEDLPTDLETWLQGSLQVRQAIADDA